MHGKKPTKKQAMLITKYHLNYKNWLVCKDTPEEMVIKHRLSDKEKTIRKVSSYAE